GSSGRNQGRKDTASTASTTTKATFSSAGLDRWRSAASTASGDRPSVMASRAINEATTGGVTIAHQKIPRTANSPMAKKTPKNRSDGHGVLLPRHASTPTTAAAERKNAAPEKSRIVGGCHSVTNLVISGFVE